VQDRADTLQVRPCKLAVAILGDTTVGTVLHPTPPAHSELLLEKPPPCKCVCRCFLRGLHKQKRPRKAEAFYVASAA